MATVNNRPIHLEYFTVIWYVFWSFVIFSQFWYVVPRKIWQPCKYLVSSLHRRKQMLAMSRARDQGCQIFLDTIYQSGEKIYLNYQMAIKYTKRA
jgi:hypothetical protein